MPECSIVWRTNMKALSFHGITQKSKWEIFEKASFQNFGLMVTQWNVSWVKEKIKMKGLEDLMVKRYQGVRAFYNLNQ